MVQQVLQGKIVDTTSAVFFALVVSLIVLAYSALSLSVLLVICLIIIGILLETGRLNGIERKYGLRLLFSVFAVYLVSSIFFSYAFRDGHYYLTPDCLHYFSNLGMHSMDIDPGETLFQCYVLFNDGDGLHELFYRYCILFANNYLGGASVLYLMLTNVFFGVLALAPVYRILLTAVTPDKAFKYALLFGLLSPFHFYSVDFVRDITVAFFYAHAIEIVVGKFKIRNLFLLVVFVFIVWGIRLYSGLFLIAFALYYPVKSMAKNATGRIMVAVLSIIFVVAVVPSLMSLDIYLQSSDEFELYSEYNQSRMSTSSLTAQLDLLPSVLREVSLGVYSVIMPFPCFLTIGQAHAVEQFYMSSVVATYAFYMYFLAIGLIIMLFGGKYYKKLKFETDWLLLLLVAVYIVFNLSHPDTRRLMAIYPIMLLYYVKSKEYCKQTGFNVKSMTQTMTWAYFILSVVYMVIKA